ncbi:hypothetical protein H0H87_010649 [Tephrocybe sp. NHM501043]|nr:hypothetical protein H0H87_010649 [Tephrocybe sp. NHM501043]
MSLSLGLELEAVCTGTTTACLKDWPTWMESRIDLIAEYLQLSGVGSTYDINPATQHDEDWLVTIDDSLKDLSDSSEQENTANQVLGPRTDDSRLGVELVSPILRHDEWQSSVEKVLETLHTFFTFKCNRSTGIHVHVGRGAQGFDLETIKRLAITVIRFEDAIDSLHPPHRVNGNLFLRPLRSNGLLQNSSFADIYRQILEAADEDAVIKIVNFREGDPYNGRSEARYAKVNFTAIKLHGTVEFRQCQGTLDTKIITPWVEFVIRLVKFATTSSDQDVQSLDRSVQALSDEIGLPWEVL